MFMSKGTSLKGCKHLTELIAICMLTACSAKGGNAPGFTQFFDANAVSGLQLWLTAAHSAGPTLTDIQTWADTSGQGHDCAFSAVVGSKARSIGVFAELPFVTFSRMAALCGTGLGADGSYFFTEELNQDGGGLTAFLVVRNWGRIGIPDDEWDTTGSEVLSIGNFRLGIHSEVSLANDGTNIRKDYAFTAVGTLVQMAEARDLQDAPVILTVRFHNSSQVTTSERMSIWLDGHPQTLTILSTGDAAFDPSNAGLWLGSSNNEIDVAEVLVYQTALTVADRNHVECYLLDKYDLSGGLCQ